MESKDSETPQNQKLAPLKKNNKNRQTYGKTDWGKKQTAEKNNKDNYKFSRARNVGRERRERIQKGTFFISKSKTLDEMDKFLKKSVCLYVYETNSKICKKRESKIAKKVLKNTNKAKGRQSWRYTENVPEAGKSKGQGSRNRSWKRNCSCTKTTRDGRGTRASARCAGAWLSGAEVAGSWAPWHRTHSHVHVREDGTTAFHDTEWATGLNGKNRPVSSWSQSRRKCTSG